MSIFLSFYLAAFLVFIFVGLYAKRRYIKVNYYRGHWPYGTLAISSGILASFIGGGSILNLIDISNLYGYWAYSDVVPTCLGLLLAAVLVTKDRASAFFAATHYRNAGTHIFHHIVIYVLYTLVMTAQFVGLTKLLLVAEVDIILFWIFLSALFIWIYSRYGYESVMRTDKIQLIFLIIGFYIISAVGVAQYLPLTDISLLSVNSEPMPISLVIALSLPFFFVPISQEIHQRAATAVDNRVIRLAFILSALVYFLLGSTTIFIGTHTPQSGLSGIINLFDNIWISAIIYVSIVAALISTIDTSLNISVHSVSKVMERTSYRLSGHIIALPVVFIAVFLSAFFPTILSVILLALFIYMSGPAFLTIIRLCDFEERIAIGFSSFAIAAHLGLKLTSSEQSLLIGLVIISVQFLGILFVWAITKWRSAG